MFTRGSGESSGADAVAVDALPVAVAVGHLALVVLQLTLETFPAWNEELQLLNSVRTVLS